MAALVVDLVEVGLVGPMAVLVAIPAAIPVAIPAAALMVVPVVVVVRLG